MTQPNTTGAQALSDEQLTAMVEAAGGDVLHENATASMPGDFVFKLDADALRNLLAGREQAGAVAPQAKEVWKPSALESIPNCLDNSLKRAASLLRSNRHAGDAIDASRLEYLRAALAAPGAAIAAREQEPIDMVLHCPRCGLQHVDAPEDEREENIREGGEVTGSVTVGWDNPPHKSHLCHGCGHIWRPADVPTNGVQTVKTTGKADSPIASREETRAASAVPKWIDDPHDIEQGQMLSPAWLKLHGMTLREASAPVQSTAPNAELLRGWKRYEKLRKLTPAAFNRLHIISVTGGNSFDDLVDALPEPSTPVPEQSAKGLTMGGEDAK